MDVQLKPSEDASVDPIRAAKDCLAGSVGGVCQVLAGQPFDTVKVRLQTQSTSNIGSPPIFKGPLDCVLQTYRNEGLAGFYKGTATPLVGIGICVSIQFLVMEHMKRVFSAVNKDAESSNPQKLNPIQLFVSGASCGLASSIVSGPMEHIRTRLQIQVGSQNSPHTQAHYKGPIDCIQKIYSNHGIRGLYKGQLATMAREFFGCGFYFTTYEYLVQRTLDQERIQRNQLHHWQVCAYGAAAGYAFWGLTFPIDVLKSKMQTDAFVPHHQKYPAIIKSIRFILQSEGVSGFYRGFIPCILRAAPANAATFLGFELAMRSLQ